MLTYYWLVDCNIYICRETGVPFHNLITWQDLRAVDYVSQWNRSYRLLALNTFAKLLYTLFRNKQYLAASVLKFLSKHVTMRLLWVFDNIPEVSDIIIGIHPFIFTSIHLFTHTSVLYPFFATHTSYSHACIIVYSFIVIHPWSISSSPYVSYSPASPPPPPSSSPSSSLFW